MVCSESISVVNDGVTRCSNLGVLDSLRRFFDFFFFLFSAF